MNMIMLMKHAEMGLNQSGCVFLDSCFCQSYKFGSI